MERDQHAQHGMDRILVRLLRLVNPPSIAAPSRHFLATQRVETLRGGFTPRTRSLLFRLWKFKPICFVART